MKEELFRRTVSSDDTQMTKHFKLISLLTDSFEKQTYS